MKTANNHGTCLIGRQPILDANEEIVSYELLFRSVGAQNNAVIKDASHATANVIINTLSEFGLKRILGHHKGFINVELDLLMSDAIELLPKEQVVLELLETLQLTPELVERCRELKDKGFVLALDDHQFDPSFNELYQIAEIIKIDLFQTPVDQLDGMIEQFRRYPVKLLAEKVETREEFQQCRDRGFEYFQGYYFAKPAVIEKRRIDENASALLKLMNLLAKDTEIDQIEKAFKLSPALTYKLLMLVNSVLIGMRVSINSVRHALVVLGRHQVLRWVQLALFATNDNLGTANPLVDMAAVRAGFMEQLAKRHPLLKGDMGAADQAFMVGILSLLESIYDIKPEELVDILNLSHEVAEALTSRSGILGRLLEFAEQMERSFFRLDFEQLAELGVTEADVQAAQIESYQWLGEP
jgi:c-di-GMP-related signal transduction protein